MSRIPLLFDTLREEKRAAFIPFIMAGDPNLARTAEIMSAIADSGADIIELGVPFSDPMADGPTIQAAGQRALKNKIRLADILKLVSGFRKKYNTPIVLFGYANPFLAYGWERLAKDSKAAGVDAYLCVDLPPDEGAPLRNAARAEDQDVIYLLAPTSTKERREYVAKHASGFLYYVSVTGVTGAREKLREDIGGQVSEIKKVSPVPVAVGFGISTAEHVREVAGISDGVVVGSAIVKLIGEIGDSPDLAKKVAEFVRKLRSGID